MSGKGGPSSKPQNSGKNSSLRESHKSEHPGKGPEGCSSYRQLLRPPHPNTTAATHRHLKEGSEAVLALPPFPRSCAGSRHDKTTQGIGGSAGGGVRSPCEGLHEERGDTAGHELQMRDRKRTEGMTFPKRNGAERKKVHRAAMFVRQKGACHYCGTQMLLMWTCPTAYRPDNLCTIEHLRDRFHPDRQEPGNDRRHVAACLKCNFEKGRESVLAQPIHERWKAAGAYPLGIEPPIAAKVESEA